MLPRAPFPLCGCLFTAFSKAAETAIGVLFYRVWERDDPAGDCEVTINKEYDVLLEAPEFTLMKIITKQITAIVNKISLCLV